VSRGGGATARHAIRLLEERDAQPRRLGGLRRREEIGCAYATARSVSERQYGDRTVDRVEVSPRKPVGGLDLEDRSSLVVIESAEREDGR
jgi:hypothetical protein